MTGMSLPLCISTCLVCFQTSSFLATVKLFRKLPRHVCAKEASIRIAHVGNATKDIEAYSGYSASLGSTIGFVVVVVV
eukprot:1575055-Amphidinium_carterae.1